MVDPAAPGDDAAFGALLRRYRIAAGLTQEQLAERAGMSVRGVSDLERSARTHPQRETVRLLVVALGLTEVERAALLAAVRRAPRLRLDLGPVAVADPFPNASLPFTGTPLIGRYAAIGAVAELLADPACRLVTLIGAGGIGKTRLAIAAAEAVRPSFPDGVAFVSLAALRDAELVPGVVAGALGVRDAASRAPTEAIAQVFRGRRALLVLDNLEQLVPAVSPWIAGVLAACPGLTILATSRAALHVYGEREYPLAPLALPERIDPPLLPSLERLRQYEAVRLFVARSQAVNPGFALTDANAQAVAEICWRVDGLPLAIELAAAHVKVLPPMALVKRMARRLPILTGGAQTAPVRQQTMRAAIAWSCDLLGAAERWLFAWLAVFPEGCTLDAAEAVAGREGGHPDVYTGVATLVDKSLLRPEGSIDGEPRFRMLETVREYALEMLDASGEGEQARGRLADWCLAQAEAAEPPFPGDAMDPVWVRRLDGEASSLRASVIWLLERGRGAAALRLLTAAQDYWGCRVLDTADLVAWVSAALAAAPDAPLRDRVVARHTLTWANAFLGRYDEAVHQAEAGLAAGESGDAALAGMAWFDVGMASDYRGDMARAASAYERAERLLRAAGFESLAATALAELGDKLVVLGEVERAAPMLDAAIPRLERIGGAWGVALALGQRGFAALADGDVPLAARRFGGSIAASQRNADDRRTALGAAMGLAGVASRLGEAERAARILAGARAALERLGIVTPAHALHRDGIEAAVRAALDPEALTAAWGAGRLLTIDEVIAEALAIADEAAAGERPSAAGSRPRGRAAESARVLKGADG